MIVITTPLGVVGLLAMVYLGGLFSNFSRRLSAVTRMAGHYRWFLVANYLIAAAAMSQIIRSIAALAPQLAPSVVLTAWFSLFSFHIPLVVGLSVDLVLVWYYWGWILTEKVK